MNDRWLGAVYFIIIRNIEVWQVHDHVKKFIKHFIPVLALKDVEGLIGDIGAATTSLQKTDCQLLPDQSTVCDDVHFHLY